MSAYSTLVGTLNAVGYWRMNDASPNNCADSSGNGYTAAQNGFGTVNYQQASLLVSDTADKCIEFVNPADPTNSSIHTEVEGTAHASIVTWVSRASTGTTMIGFDNGSGSAFGILWQADDTVECYAQTSAGQYYTATVATTGTVMLALVFDGTQGVALDRLKLYVNGTRVTLANTGGVNVGTTLAATLGSFQLNGVTGSHSSETHSVDEVSLHDISLSAAQVLNLYNVGADIPTDPPATPTNLAASVNGTTVTITYNTDDTEDSTTIQIHSDATFLPTPDLEYEIPAEGTTVEEQYTLSNGTYYVRVKATNVNGDSSWASTISFTIGLSAGAGVPGRSTAARLRFRRRI